jgi:hypothetical protein
MRPAPKPAKRRAAKVQPLLVGAQVRAFERRDRRHNRVDRQQPRACPMGRHWRGDHLPPRQAGAFEVNGGLMYD